MKLRVACLLVVVLTVPVTTAGPAVGAPSVAAGPGGFSCEWRAPIWPATSISIPCTSGSLPGQGTAWGSWTNGHSVKECSPTCTAYAEFYPDSVVCARPNLPVVAATGTGWLWLDGSYSIPFDWTLAGTAMLFTPPGAVGTGTFLPVPQPPTGVCVAPQSDHVAHVTATLDT